MDVPILKYVDVLIGLAAVVLLVCTVVAAGAQMLLSYTFTKARHLRDGLGDMISQIDPATLGPHARYIAERLLRHPLVARDNTRLGLLFWKMRAALRRRRGKPPLPSLNPCDTMQREEIVLLMLEWAAQDGALITQDLELSAGSAEEAGRLKEVRVAIQTALDKAGVGDAGATARAIRDRIMKKECEDPGQASAVTRAQAVAAVPTGDLGAKIHYWYDNTIARVKDNYALTARVVAAVLALFVVFGIQFDAVNLIQRLVKDDKLRASLLSEAEVQTRRYEDARQALGAAAAAGQPAPDAEWRASDASLQRERISAALADLRDPNRGIVPSYPIWSKLAQTRLCTAAALPKGHFEGKVAAGPAEAKVSADLDELRPLDELAAAIRASGAPVSVYAGDGCLTLVAQSAGADSVALAANGKPLTASVKGVDWFGIRRRLPGMLLAWVLVALGSPFWYDLLKKVLGFRSVLASKDDEDRNRRQQEQPKAA
jgi:hypothetical protein